MSGSRYFIRLSYDGTNYNGWQVQENAITVQQLLEESLALQLGLENASLTGCGRTDTGVHAREFYAHFDFDKQLDEESLAKLQYKLNSHLPPDIAIQKVFPVSNELHSRFSARSRTYQYFIHQEKDPFLIGRSWYIYGGLDVGLMNEGAKLLMHYEDFTSFARLHTQTKTNFCRLTCAQWDRENHQLIFTITADRFLRNMVRAIVGTLVEVGRGKTGLDKLRRIIESKNRSLAGASAPAKGLFLTKVTYDDTVETD